MPKEIELKLRMPPAQARRLSIHPALAGFSRQKYQLFNTYYDTPGLELQKRGIALRLRRKGSSIWLMTVKGGSSGAGGLAQRNEWEAPTQPGVFDFAIVTDEPLRNFLIERSSRLQPVFSTDFTRTAWVVKRGGAVIEVALDRGKIDAPRFAGAGRALSEPLCEVELELCEGGSADVLFDLAIELASNLHLHPEIVSKAERGYVLAAGNPTPPAKSCFVPLVRETTPVDAFRAIALSCVAQLQRNEPGAITGINSEYLHQARVAIRRLRSAIRLFAPVLSPSFVEVYLPRWRNLANCLGGARDWDVFLSETLTPLEAAFPGDADLAELKHRGLAAKAAVQGPAAVALTQKNYSQLLLAFSAALLRIEPPTIAGKKPKNGTSLRKFARRVLQKRLNQIEKTVAGHGKMTPERRHELRIAFKKLRYALEFFAPILPSKRLAAYQASLAVIQDLLGLLNDQITASRLIKEMHPKGEPDPLTRGWIAGRTELLVNALALELKRFSATKSPWC